MNKGLGYGSGPFSFIMDWTQQSASHCLLSRDAAVLARTFSSMSFHNQPARQLKTDTTKPEDASVSGMPMAMTMMVDSMVRMVQIGRGAGSKRS
ncbi:hypothetical protein [Synechococcus sp. BMK-MC-1]|uniref:hypothetical protein n=1 Tax=Synechococcus sp. BMK-MC-1 TaxID=1442551 RepID=UPI0016447B57|nr:hypothetical protein [Synechococcus sp. BMK-MC-1]